MGLLTECESRRTCDKTEGAANWGASTRQMAERKESDGSMRKWLWDIADI
jgi:hypothetical protein